MLKLMKENNNKKTQRSKEIKCRGKFPQTLVVRMLIAEVRSHIKSINIKRF